MGGGPAQLIGSLLAALHRSFSLPVCRDDLLSTTGIAGALFAVFPVLGALLVALVRKWTGNNYGVGVVTVFTGCGLVFVLLLPWLAFNGAVGALHDAAIGQSGVGRLAGAIGGRSCFVDDQRAYLGDGPTVYEAVFHPADGKLIFVQSLALLVALPFVGWLFVLLQARTAVRRGPRWPGRLLWIPFLLLMLATGGLNAHVVAQLWLGFVPASFLGVLLVLLVGQPRRSVINSSTQDRYDEPGHPQPHPPRSAAPLADTPGPLPFGPGEESTAPVTPGGPTVGGGRFRRVRALGTGGFGTVWLAVDTQLDRTVAVKFAHAPDAETEQRMLREARALAAVRHPNCVHVYDIVSEPDGLGIVMEYIDGAALSDAVRGNGRLNDVGAARLWAKMAGALSAAHDRAVLHRDVKPSNVIIDEAGAPHLIDFGIARARGDMTLTATGMMMGTPDFLAPETANGADATPASDSWQLAATVSYALSGQPPRGGRGDVMAAFHAASRGERCSKLPRQSAHYRLLSAALESDPTRRPTLAVIRRELTGWLARSGHGEDGPILPVNPSQQGTRRI